jgi:hypothetical protein
VDADATHPRGAGEGRDGGGGEGRQGVRPRGRIGASARTRVHLCGCAYASVRTRAFIPR